MIPCSQRVFGEWLITNHVLYFHKHGDIHISRGAYPDDAVPNRKPLSQSLLVPEINKRFCPFILKFKLEVIGKDSEIVPAHYPPSP